MNSYRVTVAELSTGIVRRVDAPEQRYRSDRAGQMSRVFEDEQEALRFKDQVLRQFSDLEVVVRPAEATAGGRRFYIQDGSQVSDTFRSD